MRKSQKQNRGDRWSKDEGHKKFILPHWRTSVIWRMPNWRQSTKNTKVELYSDVTLWKMILDLTQYSLNKNLQHLKWQPPRSWISSPDCRVAMDKQLTQYLLNTQAKMEYAHKITENSQIGMSRHLDSSTTITYAQNHGPVWKSQSFLLNEICMVILLAGLLWQRPFGLSLLGYGWEKVSLWECFLYTVKKDYSYLVYGGWHQIGWKETKY